MAQRGSWTDLSKQEIPSPSLACRKLARARSSSQTDLFDPDPSPLMARYFASPGKLRLAVKPGLGVIVNKGSCSNPSERLTDDLDSTEDEATVKKKTFNKAKDSIRLRKNSPGSTRLPSISITLTEESESAVESIRDPTVHRPPQTELEQKNSASIVDFTEVENVINKSSNLKFLTESKSGSNKILDMEIPENLPESVKANGDSTSGSAATAKKVKAKVPIVTNEMLQKHSYHYYLMHNFFLSESSSSSYSEDEVTPTVTKKVTFKLEPEYIPPEPSVPRPEHCSCNQRNPTKYAYIQVAGTMFQTHWTTLDRHPDTLLGSNDKFQYYDYNREVFSFPHIRQDCFESILFYYQDGILRSPKGVKEEVFLSELDFFGIRHDKITVGPYEHELQENYDHVVPEDQDSFQARVFLLLYHKSSTSTKIYTFVDIIFILTSVISFLTATIPTYKPPLDPEDRQDWSKERILFYSRYGAIKEFVIIDGICMVWFFTMFILHYYAAPRKRSFLKSFQSGIDLILITAFAISIALAYSPFINNSFLQTTVRLTFSLRILKLSQHSLLLNSLGMALKEASRELISVLLFVFVIVFIFACFEYLVEIEEPTTSELKEVSFNSSDFYITRNFHDF